MISSSKKDFVTSLAKIIPVFCINAAKKELFIPVDETISTTVSFVWGANDKHGRNEVPL